MRSIWKGSVAFGLVNVPVKLYSATEDHDVDLHMVHNRDGGRIRYERRCEVCGRIVKYADIDKAYDDGERTVVITEDDLKALPAEKSREISVEQFVPSDQLDPIMYDRSYYLEPDGSSSKAYQLLLRTLEKTDRTAIVTFALRQRTRLAALRVRGDVLVLQTLLWDDEIRTAEFDSLENAARVSARELEMSEALVDSYSQDFTPDEFQDDYQVQLKKLIDAKLKEGDALDTEATFGEQEGGGGEVLDLMEALRKSVEASKGASKSESKGSSRGAAGSKSSAAPKRKKSAS